ncbi:MAG: CBS domain-containing protein [Pseudomonadota bacterium]
MPNRPIHYVIENQTPLTCDSNISVSKAASLMKQYGVGAVMVVENDLLIGIFTERDALFRVLAEERDPHTTYLNEVMTASPQMISPDKPLGHALHMMFEGGFRHVPVVQNGKVVGMVSSRDALGTEIINFETELVSRNHIAEVIR